MFVVRGDHQGPGDDRRRFEPEDLGDPMQFDWIVFPHEGTIGERLEVVRGDGEWRMLLERQERDGQPRAIYFGGSPVIGVSFLHGVARVLARGSAAFTGDIFRLVPPVGA